MSKLLSFHGRASRLGYLKVELGLYAAVYAAMFLILISGVALHLNLPTRDIPFVIPRWDLPGPLATVIFALALLTFIPIIWIALAVDVRRLHDIGVTGWCVLLSFVLTKLVPEPANWPSLMPGPGNLLWDAAMLLIPGTVGLNKYNAKAERDVQQVF